MRKKKRVSKVGFGREEDGDADSPASPTPAGSASGASGAGGGTVGGRGSSAISALPAIEEDQDNDADPALYVIILSYATRSHRYTLPSCVDYPCGMSSSMLSKHRYIPFRYIR